MSIGETATELAPALRGVPRRLLGDGRLARLAARGDTAAFEVIFRRYQQELYRYCMAMLRDPEEAQDALQSTMAAALRSLPQDRRDIALRPWLYRVAHNEAVSIIRRRGPVADPAMASESPVPGADASVEARERLRRLVTDLCALPDRQRGALVMRELSGLGYGEIAAALGASEAAARQVVYEARVALRELEEGRQMECEEARRALSAHDRRILRGRRLRSHLRTCEGCRDFRSAIQQRRSDLDALCPPLPVAAASGLVASVLAGTGSGGSGAVAGSGAALGAVGTGSGIGAATMTIGASAGVKAASLAVAVAVGAGTAGATGIVDTPWTPDRSPSKAVDARSSAPDRSGSGSAPAGAGDAARGDEAERQLRAPPRPGESTKPGDRSVAETHSQGASAGAAGSEQRRPDGSGEADGPPAQAGARGEPPAHTSAQGGGPPAHASESGGPPAHAGRGVPAGPERGQVGPPAHAGAGSGPPPHASASEPGGAAAAGGSPPARASSGARGSNEPAAPTAVAAPTSNDRRTSVPELVGEKP
jgi:RNA polymerase sigma factor (sigma-70 family)